MSAVGPVKALLIAVAEDTAPTIHTLQHLTPDLLCFFLPETRKGLVESEIQPQLSKMPQRWDWVITPDPQSFAKSHRALAEQFPGLLKTWEVSPGDLVVDLTSATPSMSAAMTLVAFPYTSRIVVLTEAQEGQGADPKLEMVGNTLRLWSQSNPWDEEVPRVRQEACVLFNQGGYSAAAQVFRRIENRVSGGLKPLYRSFVDVCEGYRLWECFQYRQAWDKLKGGAKALDLASAWGGPGGVEGFLRSMKDNIRFLEQVVLDPQEVKPRIADDLLAHAKRKVQRDRDAEAATKVLLRALEAFAQAQLFQQYKIKSWDVKLEQLPQAVKETCQTCYLNDIDGKYRLPLYAQFRALEGLGDSMGQRFLSQWAKMKSLFDAADHSILGHGFDPIKVERFHQLYEVVVKLVDVNESALPQFPSLHL